MAVTTFCTEKFVKYDVAEEGDFTSLLNSIVVPRPIALITSGYEVVNAAPFSYFNIVSTRPPIISVAITRKKSGECKDTARNIFLCKEFVVNICSVEHAREISLMATDFPPEVSEVELLQFSMIPSQKISVPRIANTMVQMECVYRQAIHVETELGVDMILGEVVMVHLHENLLYINGEVDLEKLNPLARFGGTTFGKVSDFFDMARMK